MHSMSWSFFIIFVSQANVILTWTMLNFRYITYLAKTADTKLSSRYKIRWAVYLYNNGLYLNAKYRFLEFEIFVALNHLSTTRKYSS